MKTLKRISALLLAVLLMASFSITAFAEIVTVTGGGGEGGSSAVIGILEGTATVTYTDSNGGPHGLDLPGGEKPTIIDEGGGHNTPGVPNLPDIGKDDIKDFIQQQINNNDPVNQRPGINNENNGSGASGDGSASAADYYTLSVVANQSGNTPAVTCMSDGSVGYPISFDSNGAGTIIFDGYTISIGTTLNADNSITLEGAVGGNCSGLYAENSTVNLVGNEYGSSIVYTTGVGINAKNSTVTSDGEVTVGGNGIVADSSTVKVTGDVTSTGGSGIKATNSTITVGGDVNACGEYVESGISAFANAGGTTTVTSGDVNSNITYFGINAGAFGSDSSGKVSSVTVETGNITNNYEDGKGVNVDAGDTFSPGNVTVKAGDIDAKGNGLDVNAVNGGKADITADNISGSSTGIYVNTDTTSKATVTVGTAGDYNSGNVTGGIVFAQNVTADSAQITLWRTDSISFINEPTNSDDIIKAVLNYYVRYEDKAVENGSFSIKDNPAVLNGNDSVELTLNPAEGYEVDTVYYNQGDNRTIAPKDGKYILKPDTAGGIKLWATFKLSTPAPTPDPNPPKPDPKPTPVGPMAAVTYKLKFDLDGGVMPDGMTELELKCSAGQKITLPEAPTREGFTFVGWQTTVRGNTVILDAGAKFTVTAAKTFVALWEEN